MKKILSLLVITLVIATACNTTKKATAQKAEDNIALEYTATTRGMFNKVIIKKDTVVTIKDRDMKDIVTKKLSKAQWDGIVAALASVKLDEMQNLKPPSTKSHYDAAAIGGLQVIKNGVTYQSSGFDHGNPPAEIKDVVTKVLAASDLKQLVPSLNKQ
jgi:hypothetical protein